MGRRRYFALANPEVAALLETVMGLSARQGRLRTRTGPTDTAMRRARVCCDHLAGDLGVRMFDSMTADDAFRHDRNGLTLSDAGRRQAEAFGIDMAALTAARRPVCRSCLDWSARRSHIAGGLGAAMLQRFYDLGWARRAPNSRVVSFTPPGLAAFEKAFPVTD